MLSRCRDDNSFAEERHAFHLRLIAGLQFSQPAAALPSEFLGQQLGLLVLNGVQEHGIGEAEYHDR